MIGGILIAWWAWRRAGALNRSQFGWAILSYIINGAIQRLCIAGTPASVMSEAEMYLPAKLIIGLAALLLTVMVVEAALPRPPVYRAGLLDRTVAWMKFLAIILLPQMTATILMWWAAPAKMERLFHRESPLVLAGSILVLFICWYSWTMALYEATADKGFVVSAKSAAHHWRTSFSRLPLIGRWFPRRGDSDSRDDNP